MEKIKKTLASESILLKELQLNGCVTLKEAMSNFNMSEATARRLFARMEEKGLGIRSHGKISLPDSTYNFYRYEASEEIYVKEKKAIAEVLLEEGYISSTTVEGEGVKSQIIVVLKYVGDRSVIEGIERVSKSSCRVHCGSREIPRVRNGLGIVVLSTPKGIMSGRKAAKENVGGEILCRVW